MTAAQALSARSAAPSNPHPREMEKPEAVEKWECAGWSFTWLEPRADSDLTQGGKDVFMLKERALVL